MSTNTTSVVKPRRPFLIRIERNATAAALRMLRVRKGRERVARGFALGLVINFLPTFGFGVFVSGFVARLFGGHFGAGIIGGASLTPFWLVLFFLNVRMGDFLLGRKPEIGDPSEVTDKMVNSMVLGKAFILGSMANMIIAGLVSYAIMLVVLVMMRRTTITYLRYRINSSL